jgi:mRNA interferase YafQ
LRGILWTNQFKKDFKRAQTQSKDIDALKEIITKLARGDKLPGQYKDHPLWGEWNQFRDCHIKPDWILIYRLTADTLILARLGSHSELFR